MTDFNAPRRRVVLAVLLASLLASCAPLPERAPAPSTPDFHAAYYRSLAAQGQPVLRIDGPASLISIKVYRAGALARLGHDHAIASHTLTGWVAPQAGVADCRFRLDQLSIDEPAQRSAAGFEGQPSADDIDGTRHNMLVKVLDAEQFPFVLLHMTRQAGSNTVELTVTLHGVTRSMTVPTAITTQADGALLVSGTLSLKQSDFGMTPYSVLGGAIAVQDQLDMHFRILAVAQ